MFLLTINIVKDPVFPMEKKNANMISTQIIIETLVLWKFFSRFSVVSFMIIFIEKTIELGFSKIFGDNSIFFFNTHKCSYPTK